jgi:hypothetical protein
MRRRFGVYRSVISGDRKAEAAGAAKLNYK